MHKWQRFDKSIAVLCEQCSKKEYKVLDIREPWKRTEMGKKYSCDICGKTIEVSRPSYD